MAARPLSPHAPQATESVFGASRVENCWASPSSSRRPAHGRLTRRAEGGGSGRVENKIASVVVAQGLQQLACRLRFYRENGSQLVVIKLLQGRVSQYASGMNRSGNAAVGRQIVKNRGQLPGIAHITTADARLPALHVA